ncbi:MAG: 1-acyl-sn-glycerol-3-phosphate acyltransferase [Spirochaetes bacterium]|nr:1-acyl-sn-glycerol-3-phosphate acyltransferase [Spirochaetota bacterium]
MKKSDGVITSGIYDGVIYERLNPLLEKLALVLFNTIDFDDESRSRIEECAKKGHIVYASFQSSNLSLLILYNLLRRHKYPVPVFALEYNPFWFQDIGFITRRLWQFFSSTVLGKQYEYVLDTDYVESLIKDNKSILFSLLSKRYFLKRYTEVKYDSLRYLIEVQKRIDDPIYLLPEMIFWNRNPERSGSPLGPLYSIISSQATGDKSLLFAWLTIMKSATPPFVRISQPINLKEEIANAKVADTRQLAVMLRNKLLEDYYHEKRTILGPVLKSQQEMMERVLYHPNVENEIKRIAQEDGVSEAKLRKQAYKYFKEIAANFSILYIRLFEMALDWMFRKIFDGIRYDPKAIEEIRQAATKGPLVLTPCHKSHLDYLLLSYVFYKNKMSPPYIAAGVNLSFFPMGTIFRHSGAFFIRRTFRGLKLYPTVFKQYVKTIISEGYTIEFFIEGGRSRTGKVAFPKLGFLSYITEAIDEGYNTDLVFVPISINYDRILEESSYVQELKGKEKEKESVVSMMQSSKLLNRKYGMVYINFNRVFTLKEIKNKFNPVNVPEAVAMNIVRKINEVVTITPFSLTTTAILMSSVKGFSREMVKSNFESLYDYCEYKGYQLSDALKNRNNFDEIIDYVIQSFKEDKILESLKVVGEGKKLETMPDMYVLPEENRPRMIFYKNSIIHYFLPLTFSSLALRIMNKNKDTSLDSFRSEYVYIRDLFMKEFIYPEDMLEDVMVSIQDAIKYMQLKGFASITKNSIAINDDREMDAQLRFFGRILQEYLESYYVVCKTLLPKKRIQIQKKDLLTEIRKNGVKMYHTGEIMLSESLSLPNYTNALSLLRSEKALSEKQVGRKNIIIELINQEKVETLFEKIKIYLDGIRA